MVSSIHKLADRLEKVTMAEPQPRRRQTRGYGSTMDGQSRLGVVLVSIKNRKAGLELEQMTSRFANTWRPKLIFSRAKQTDKLINF